MINDITTQYKYVTVNKAPTDDSIKLLREMESCAKKEVIKSLVLPSNDLRGVVHYVRDYLSCNDKIVVLLKLNGKTHEVNVLLDDFVDDSLDKRIRKIIEAVSVKLASEVCESIFDKKFIESIKTVH